MKAWMDRSGVWVETESGVGIRSLDTFKNKGADGKEDGTERKEWWIHLVNDDGTTLCQIPADRCGEVVIARRESIPAERIAHLSEEQLTAMGYV